MRNYYFYGGPAHRTQRQVDRKTSVILICEGTERHKYVKVDVPYKDGIIVPVFALAKKQRTVEKQKPGF